MIEETCVTLYRVTGDLGTIQLHALDALEYPTHYHITEPHAALSAHVYDPVVRKGQMGGLALSPGEALLAFVIDLDKAAQDLLQVLKGVRALRAQALIVAGDWGIEIDIGDPGAEAEGIDPEQAETLGHIAAAFAQGAVFLGEMGVNDAYAAHMASSAPDPEPPFADPYDEGYDVGYAGEDRACPYGETERVKAQRWNLGYSHGHETYVFDTADWGDGTMGPERELKKAALDHRGRP